MKNKTHSPGTSLNEFFKKVMEDELRNGKNKNLLEDIRNENLSILQAGIDFLNLNNPIAIYNNAPTRQLAIKKKIKNYSKLSKQEILNKLAEIEIYKDALICKIEILEKQLTFTKGTLREKQKHRIENSKNKQEKIDKFQINTLRQDIAKKILKEIKKANGVITKKQNKEFKEKFNFALSEQNISFPSRNTYTNYFNDFLTSAENN